MVHHIIFLSVVMHQSTKQRHADVDDECRRKEKRTGSVQRIHTVREVDTYNGDTASTHQETTPPKPTSERQETVSKTPSNSHQAFKKQTSSSKTIIHHAIS